MRLRVTSVVLSIVLAICVAVACAADEEPKKLMIFPFKFVSQEGKTSFGNELPVMLGSELTRGGDIEVVSGASFVELVQGRKIDPGRMARMARRMDIFAVLWGALSKLEHGYALEVSVMGRDPKQKPRLFSTTAASMEKLIEDMPNLAAQIGRAVLDRPVIGRIKVEGNRRIQPDAILNKMDLKSGDPFVRSQLAEEIRSIYGLGYFDDVKISAEEADEGRVDIVVELKERPSIKQIQVEGNTVFSKDDILDALTTRSFSVVSLEKIRNDIEKIKKMYEKEGYFQPEIDYEVKELSRNEADLVFKIDEGKKSFLTDLEFDGARKLPDSDLAKVTGLKEKTWYWFLDQSGQFTREELDKVRQRLIAYYLDKGFVRVQVGEPKMTIDNGRVTVTFPIREGNRYQIRKVDVAGDLIKPKEKLIEQLQSKPRTWFSRTDVGKDIQSLTRTYNNLGYAYVDVEPRQNINDEHNFVDLTYHIDQSKRVTIGRVDIRGNEHTRDKVIRRSLVINEGDLYDADKIEASQKRLEASEFFEAVRINTQPGTRPDLMNLQVEVIEKKTGQLSAGVGYSSQDGAMGNINLKERNLFGLGIEANAKSNISGRRISYEGSLTYPYVFDTFFSGTVRAYRNQQKEQYYFRESEGFGVYTGHPLYGAWHVNGGFSRDSTKLSGVERGFAPAIEEYYAKFGMTAESQKNLSQNTLALSFVRDTRVGSTIPRGGSMISLSSRYSGLGADVEFSRHFTEMVVYQPLFWKAIMKVRANGSMLVESGNKPIPFDRRILLGGIHTIRGYMFGQIGPRDRHGYPIGGDRALYANIECLFPLLESYNLHGVVFADVGNAWNVEDSPFPEEVKAGAGAGIRWLSPMGPIRLEYGWKLTPEKGDVAGKFEFAMGQLF